MNNRQLAKEYLQYLLPSIASMVSLSLYILADTYFIAIGVGDRGLTALNIVLPAYALINATGLMLGVGAGVMVAVSRGTGDSDRANRTFGCAAELALIAGIVLTVLGTAFTDPLARLLGASDQALPLATSYLRTIAVFSVFFLLNNTLVALVRNDGNPRLAMVSMIACSMSNVVLDAFFILVLDWGMFGAAFATGLAPLIGISILSLHWIKRMGTLKFAPAALGRKSILPILRGGCSNFIIELGNGTVILLFNQTLLTLSGDLGVAAYGIVTNIALVISSIFTGIGQGLQPVASRYHGEGDFASTRRLLTMALWVSIGFGAVFFALGQMAPAGLASVFNWDNNPELAAITIRAIRIYFVAFLFMGVNICCASWFQSVLLPKPAAALSLLRAFVLVIAGVCVFPRLLGLDGVWMIVPFAEVAATAVCVGLLGSRRRSRQAGPERNPA